MQKERVARRSYLNDQMRLISVYVRTAAAVH